MYVYVYADSKVHGANTGPIWVLSAPDGLHVGPMNLAIRAGLGQPYYYPCPSEITLDDRDQSKSIEPQINTTKHERCAHFIEYTVP